MNDCIFCKIIKGDIPSYTVYENNDVKAFLDTNPNADGHVLVVPKTHYENLFDTPDEMLTKMIDTIKTEIYPLLKEKLHVDGLTICQNNFHGQEIKHFHIHLIPRYKQDAFKCTFDESQVHPVADTYEKLKD